MAARPRTIRPESNVVFITGHSEYAMRAFELYASGYLLKPITEGQVRTALDNLRHPVARREKPRLTVRCFAWSGGVPVRFGRSKSKMLLAFLIDRNGVVRKWNNASPTLRTVIAVADYLDVPLEELVAPLVKGRFTAENAGKPR